MSPRVPIEQRLRSKIEPQDNGCWLWTGHRDQLGYGRIQIGSQSTVAHRIAYEHWVGPIADGLTLDHLCRNRGCVNPEHLEPVTHRENVMRGTSFAVENAAKTHCLRGHELNEENVYVKKNGARQCRLCMRMSRKRWLENPSNQAKREAYLATEHARELARERNRRYAARKNAPVNYEEVV